MSLFISLGKNMADENLEQATLPKQRRNLFIVAAALMAALHTDLTLEQFNFFGNQLKISKSQPVANFLWWLWGYWFVRFIQSFLEITDRGILKAYEARRRDLLARVGRRKLLQDKPHLFDRNKYGTDSEFSFSQPAFLTSKPTKVALRYDLHVSEFKDGLQTAGQGIGQEVVIIEGIELLKSKILAVLWVAGFTTKGTEYFLPFFVGLAPIIYWCWMSV
jgi:hypothetical protein